ncbi:hypothetical protein Tco_0771071 [Tanacetum coccineum]|uniref:Reverse transcriptase domain-containing protein n=1 Tax=Tanacetum coccineum TaxID=301880 RepID=A0ABQ4ZHB6_9ASTR
MRTRSQSRNLNRQQQQAPPAFVEPFNLEEPIENPAPLVVPMADNRTMAQLLQAPTEGYEDAIVIPEINANFELKHGLINLVQNKQFFGHDKEDPHAHIRYFNKITSTMRFPDIPSTSIKLMLFPFSLEGSHAFLALEDDPNSPEVVVSYYDSDGIFFFGGNSYSGPFPPSSQTMEIICHEIRNELKFVKAKIFKVMNLLEVELKDLPPHLDTHFWRVRQSLPIHKVTKDLSSEEFLGLNFKFPSILKIKEKTTIKLVLTDMFAFRSHAWLCMLTGARPEVYVGYLSWGHGRKDDGMSFPPFFMDDFSVFGNSFENCLSRLDKMLQRRDILEEMVCEPKVFCWRHYDDFGLHGLLATYGDDAEHSQNAIDSSGVEERLNL